MSATKLVVHGAAGALGGESLNVEDVFSTYVWAGDGTSGRDIVNGIDLSNEDGAVWTKRRDTTGAPHLFNTISGANKYLLTSSTAAEDTFTSLTAFNDNGFTVSSYAQLNNSAGSYTSWTFRKAPKFFDVVTYTGDGVAGREIAHNLGTTVGTIIVKRLNAGTNWGIYHRSNTSSPEGQVLEFDTGATTSNTTIWNNTAPTSAVFTVGNSPYSNFNGSTYVAYLFAHNDDDGEFGPDGDADIIKCGSFTTDGSGVADVNLGFEPAWLLTKASSTTSYWALMDEMRGFGADVGMDYMVQPNTSNAEVGGNYLYKKNATGFSTASLSANQTYIYIAIRRGPMAVPESATDVFDVNSYTGNSSNNTVTSGFPADLEIVGPRTVSRSWKHGVASRLTGSGNYLISSATSAEQTDGPSTQFESNDGTLRNSTNMNSSADSPLISWMWRRAPNFCDVVAYTGNGTAGLNVNHNLGVVPELMIVKGRSNTNLWGVYHSALGATKYLRLDTTAAEGTATSVWNDTEPTDTQFTLGSSGALNTSGVSHIAYLFASLDGVSKVGSVSHTEGSNTDVDCGFSAGARFVILKGTFASGWQVYDTERGIVTGNDPVLLLHATAAEDSTQDRIDPYSSGFSLGPDLATGTWIYYAIA